MNPKKVLLLLIVAAAGGVAAFLYISERFAQQQIRTGVIELAGSLSPGDSHFYNQALDSRWFHRSMPPHGDEKTWGREQWKEEWRANLGTPGFRRHVVSTQILESVEDPAYPGGRIVETEWVSGVPGAWGTRTRYRMIWMYADGDWRIARLDAVGDAVECPPPPMPEK